MARIVCFADSNAVAHTVRQGLDGYDLHVLPASRLNSDLRERVRGLAPDMILMELTRDADNAHLFFFLRSDDTTRATPLILVSSSEQAAQQAAILEADGYIYRPQLRELLHETVAEHLPLQLEVAAA